LRRPAASVSACRRRRLSLSSLLVSLLPLLRGHPVSVDILSDLGLCVCSGTLSAREELRLRWRRRFFWLRGEAVDWGSEVMVGS
ncbi:unnamed protein product, partial [Brassica rapa subsp. narinosa]